MYRALYRKYRPATFEDVIGQEHIVETIKNQISIHKISHAYMFTGTRGTGKTTCAKILARAVNCEKPVNGSPCNECQTCKGLLDGSIMDVYEIDAASNNGVDNIRELREDVIFTPAQAKYKVYIIDEVHMLSTQAFNALLKTLEEPPEHIIFVFATTEINKVPATILSRCQRFDFKRITVQDIKKRLMYVCDCEGIQIDDNAAVLISKLADGAMRDALSILDRCANGNLAVTLEVVEQTIGLCAYEQITQVLSAIADGDTESMLEFYSTCRRNSKDTVSLFSELCTYLRDMMVIKLTNKPENFLEYDSDKLCSIKSIADKFSLEQIVRCIGILQSGIYDVSKFKDKHIMAEMILIKLTNPQIGEDYASLNARISALEATGVAVPVHLKPAKPEKVMTVKNEPESVPKSQPANHNTGDAMNIKTRLTEALFSVGGRPLVPFLSSLEVNLSDNIIYIKCQKSDFEYSMLSGKENLNILEKAAENVTGSKCSIRFIEPETTSNVTQNDVFSELLDSAKEILQKE